MKRIGTSALRIMDWQDETIANHRDKNPAEFAKIVKQSAKTVQQSAKTVQQGAKMLQNKDLLVNILIMCNC